MEAGNIEEGQHGQRSPAVILPWSMHLVEEWKTYRYERKIEVLIWVVQTCEIEKWWGRRGKKRLRRSFVVMDSKKQARERKAAGQRRALLLPRQ